MWYNGALMLTRNRLSYLTLILILALLTLTLPACEKQPAPATPTATGPQLLLADDFDDPASGWLEAADAEASQGYRDGQFFFQVRAPDLIVWEDAGGNFEDFVLEVSARQASGAPENSYGVLLRYVDEGNFYRFDLTGDGSYAVLKLEQGEWQTLVDWQGSAHVRPLGEVNRIQAVCQGTRMTFYVNDQMLDSVEDITFERGDVGLFVSTFAEPDVEVEFDDLEIWTTEHP